MIKRLILGKATTSTLWYILLVIVLPLVTLGIAGLVLLWQKELLLITTFIWLLAAAVAYGVLIYWPSLKAQRATHADNNNDLADSPTAIGSDNLPKQLQVPNHWTAQDQQVWTQCCDSIEQQLQAQPDWPLLPELALEQLGFISEQYHGTTKHAQYQFTVPELLLVISVTSKRYRQLVIEHVPFIDKFTIATGNSLLDQKDNIGTGYKWFSRLRRTARLLNPASAVVGELRDLISGKIFAQTSFAVQSELKRLLLQEAAQVGIDLYSGKLKISDDELAEFTSRATHKDEQRKAKPAEPIRIVLLGQTSAGKSSLVNALTNALQAEADVLPATNQLNVHQLHLIAEPNLEYETETIASLIDTPGIDGSAAKTELLLSASLDADLIIWLTKATQPARAPDQQLLQAIQAHFAEQIQKLPPPIIMVLTHIDQLTPKAQWEPPYDLQSEQAKAQSIAAAIRSALSTIGFAEDTLAVPIYIGDAHAHYNVDALASQIMMLSDASTNVQLNRRRLELSDNTSNWNTRWSQTKRLGRVLGNSIVKKVKS